MTPWHYIPSCPCDPCEDYRAENGMTCLFGGNRPPSDERIHSQLPLWEEETMAR